MNGELSIPLPIQIEAAEFERVRDLLYRTTGIRIGAAKQAMVAGRLAKRLRETGHAGLGDYLATINSPGNDRELQTAIDLLTTNETHFFREPRHFEYLSAWAAGRRSCRIWSAACSSGEEVWSIAMVLAERRGLRGAWEVVGSDVSAKVLGLCREARYPLARAQEIPPPLLRRYCLKGIGGSEGSFCIDPRLRERVRFEQINLVRPLPELGSFDAVFLRNVLIYFDNDTKRQVVQRVISTLAPEGFLAVGHSESLLNIDLPLRSLRPAVYTRL